MKKTSICLCLLLLSTTLFGQMFFSVRTGLPISGLNLGVNLNKVQPYFSLSSANFSNKWGSGSTSTSLDKYGIIIPAIGLKAFVADKNPLKAYVLAEFIKPIPYSNYSGSSSSSSLANDYIKFSFIGGKIGFGVEYYFNSAFSVGGETNFLLVSHQLEEFRVWDNSIYKDDYIVSILYSNLSFNFYFGKSE